MYDVEFSPLGFSLRAPGPVPSLVATAVAPDSVVAVMPAGLDDGVILLRGTLAGDSVLGTWSYEGRSASGWGGTLVLRHRRGT